VLNSTPVDLGTEQADQTGTVTFTFTVPVETPLGTHEVSLTGVESGPATAEFHVSAPATTPGTTPVATLVDTGSDLLSVLIGAIVLVLAGGFALTLRAVRRRQRNGFRNRNRD
jgi:adhesin/invasin